MPYRLVTQPRVRRQVQGLPQSAYERIAAAIDALASNPFPSRDQKLRGTDLWRIRAGNYCVLYSVDNTNRIVTVVSVSHRREVYREL